MGMASRHSTCRLFSLAEFTEERVKARREKLRQRLKEEKLELLRWKVRRPTQLLESACTFLVQRNRPVVGVGGEGRIQRGCKGWGCSPGR